MSIPAGQVLGNGAHSSKDDRQCLATYFVPKCVPSTVTAKMLQKNKPKSTFHPAMSAFLCIGTSFGPSSELMVCRCILSSAVTSGKKMKVVYV